MIKFILIFIIIFIYSCKTTQYKKAYIEKKGNEIFANYNINGTLISSGSQNLLPKISKRSKLLDSISFKEIKKSIKLYEKSIALVPDSVSSSNYNLRIENLFILDSFYFNKSKIKFIRKNKIKSKNIIISHMIK